MMKIATFNANSIRMRMPIVKAWLETHKPDVLAVQETKVQDADFPSEDIETSGYHVVFSGQKAYNGVALITRNKPDEVITGFDGEDERARLIRIRYGEIDIINTYIPQGRDRESEHYQYKLNWFRRFADMLEKQYDPSQKVIWLGDLNVAPEPEDVHDPKSLDGHVCFNRELTECFYNVCSWGLFDVFRKHHPEPEQFTFFDYRVRGAVSRRIGWRIDHIMVTDLLMNQSKDAWIDLEPRKSKIHKPSDHTFLTAEFLIH
jgi:exodeoxyribonuclease III